MFTGKIASIQDYSIIHSLKPRNDGSLPDELRVYPIMTEIYSILSLIFFYCRIGSK